MSDHDASEFVYLDHAASSPQRPEVTEAMAAVTGLPGNPSALHGIGRAARRGTGKIPVLRNSILRLLRSLVLILSLVLSLAMSNVAGHTKRLTVNAIVFCAYCTGTIIGPQVFLTRDAPRYIIAFSTHMGCYVLLVLVIVFLRFNLSARNKAKDRLAAQAPEASQDNLTHAFDDLTDKENPTFRYMY